MCWMLLTPFSRCSVIWKLAGNGQRGPEREEVMKVDTFNVLLVDDEVDGYR